jgi:hypothetical protein
VSGGVRLVAALAGAVATIALAIAIAPQAPVLVAVVLAGAAVLGIAAALLLPNSSSADALGAPAPAASRSRKAIAKAPSTPLELSSGAVVHIPLAQVGASLTPDPEPSEPFAELARAVRDHTPAVRLIQITSPESGEGKTTIAANLAAALASGGGRVLLIDANHDRHRAHLLLGAAPASPSSGGSVEDAIVRTAFHSLDLLVVGDSDANGTPPLSAVTWELVRGYDWTLLDTAGGVSRERPAPVVRADLNILVARADHTPPRLIQIAHARLNADPMIVVMNADSGVPSSRRSAARTSAKS